MHASLMIGCDNAFLDECLLNDRLLLVPRLIILILLQFEIILKNKIIKNNIAIVQKLLFTNFYLKDDK